jgi:hypothetical protein
MLVYNNECRNECSVLLLAHVRAHHSWKVASAARPRARARTRRDALAGESESVACMANEQQSQGRRDRHGSDPSNELWQEGGPPLCWYQGGAPARSRDARGGRSARSQASAARRLASVQFRFCTYISSRPWRAAMVATSSSHLCSRPRQQRRKLQGGGTRAAKHVVRAGRVRRPGRRQSPSRRVRATAHDGIVDPTLDASLSTSPLLLFVGLAFKDDGQ